MTAKNYMGIDQYGRTYHDLGEHPRKGLLEKLGYKNAQKMYTEYKDGTCKHTGYVVGPYWVRLYQIEPFAKDA